MNASAEIRAIFKSDHDRNVSITKTLREIKCCYRCCLRFLPTKTIAIFAVPEEARHIRQRLDDEKYQTKRINLSCTLPTSLLVRDHLLGLHLRDTLKINVSSPRDPKEPFKYILAGSLKKEIDGLDIDPAGPLRMTVVLGHEPTSSEHMFLTQAKKPVLRVRKKQRRGKVSIIGDSRSTIVEALAALPAEEARTLTTIPPTTQNVPASLASINLAHDSSYVAGRYLKYSRDFSQTPWNIKGKKLAENCVSESICEILKKYHRCDDYKFVPAGREDANVRMLGTGRPFYCELINPRVVKFDEDGYAKMEQEVNESNTKEAVQLRDLTSMDPRDTKIIKEGEQFKRKTYRALVWISEPVSQAILDRLNEAGSKPFKIQQNTPTRVFQRRAGIVREKEIHYCKAARPSRVDASSTEPEQHFMVVTLNTQAGTYIKEFVHGDLGRTQPNLATLANVEAADLIELDVMEVDLEWPPKKNNSNQKD
ncbi:hypothetical protein BX666DRAFT_1857510 [Dichotomocladium elegans]|nr:hypothetical protein BX666DRAFT_1857510 [Dichotomocladium elegans]